MRTISASPNQAKVHAVALSNNDPYASIGENAKVIRKLVFYVRETLGQKLCAGKDGIVVSSKSSEGMMWPNNDWIKLVSLAVAGMLI